jgi:hypothetical protein
VAPKSTTVEVVLARIASRQYGVVTRAQLMGLSDEVCVVVVTDSALVAGKDTDDHQDHL